VPRKKAPAAREAGQQVREASAHAMDETQAREAGAEFQWHFGRVTRLGSFELAGGRAVVIVWEEGGVTSQQGTISDAQWEIFTLAFTTTGRIAVLSDAAAQDWMYDYRFLEAVR
jgi:hypothetical protein